MPRHYDYAVALPSDTTGIERKIALAGYSGAHAPTSAEGGHCHNVALVMRQFDRHGGKPSYVTDLPHVVRNRYSRCAS